MSKFHEAVPQLWFFAGTICFVIGTLINLIRLYYR